MSDRDLRDELEQLSEELRQAELALASWNTEARVAEARLRLEEEVAELTQRGAAARVELANATEHLRLTEGELSLARDSLTQARRRIAELERPRRTGLGCATLLVMLSLAVVGNLR